MVTLPPQLTNHKQQKYWCALLTVDFAQGMYQAGLPSRKITLTLLRLVSFVILYQAAHNE